LKVLFTLSSASLTGPAERILGDARAVVEAGQTAALGCDGIRPGDLKDRAAALGVPLVSGLALCRKPTVGQVLADRRRFRTLARDEGFDVFHSHFSHDHYLAVISLAAARERVRLVRAVENEANFRDAWARRWAYRRTDGFEVASDARAQRLVSAFGISPERVAVLRGAVDPGRFSPGPAAARDTNRLRRKLGVRADVPLIGIVARMKAERLHGTLIAAFSKLASEGSNARLALVGRGEGEGALRAQVAALGLDGKISFAGYWADDELVEAYRGLDVAVWLAEGNDGTCRGVLEAMSCSVPVVVGQGGAAGELVLPGQSGLLVAPGSPTDIAAALARLAASRPEREALGAAGRRRVQSHHTWAQRGPALLEFYRRIQALPPAV
jgi:glycosyltransferase involved in cell wall biosynthesis